MSASWWRRRIRRLLVNPSLHRLMPARARRSANAVVSLAATSAWLAEAGPMTIWPDRKQLYAAVLDAEQHDEPLDYLEFGVSRGASIRWWSDALVHPDTALVGFDTFEGLPERWGSVASGTYTADGKVPDLDDARATFVVGLFQETLPGWLAQAELARRVIVHLDADLYSSTLFVLTSLAPHLKPGDVLVFDEFGSVRNAADEFRAFADFTAAYRWRYAPIGATTAYKQVALRLC